jgi:hypothetical protein
MAPLFYFQKALLNNARENERYRTQWLGKYRIDGWAARYSESKHQVFTAVFLSECRIRPTN